MNRGALTILVGMTGIAFLGSLLSLGEDGGWKGSLIIGALFVACIILWRLSFEDYKRQVWAKKQGASPNDDQSP